MFRKLLKYFFNIEGLQPNHMLLIYKNLILLYETFRRIRIFFVKHFYEIIFIFFLCIFIIFNFFLTPKILFFLVTFFPLFIIFFINVCTFYSLNKLRIASIFLGLMELVSTIFLFFFICKDNQIFNYNFIDLLFIFHYNWIPSFIPFLLEVNFTFDSVNIIFVLMTNIIIVICNILIWSWGPLFFSTRLYLNIIYLLQFCCINFFISSNLIYFYIFFESVLIPMYLLIGMWGMRDRKIHASYQFFLYTFYGSLFMIMAIIILGFYMGTFNISFIEKYWWFFLNEDLLILELFLWLFFFLSFAIKIPMVPFHIWLPEAHVEAPTGGSIILAAILLKFGTYGFYKILIEMLPFGSYFYTRLVIVFSLIAILYASIINFIQIDLKKIIAYSSVSHMGYVTLGLVLDNPEGIVGSLYMMICHGFISGALFYIVGILYERYGTRNIYYYGGLKNVMPLYSLFLFILTLCNMNLPLTGGFIAEFLVLLGTGGLCSKFIAFLSAFGLITNGVYCIWLFNRLCFGNNFNNITFIMEYKDLDIREILILSILTIIIILMGIFPNIFLYNFEISVFNIWLKNIL
jgi:NADH-quinone oxidoreductase subunit M